MGAALGVALGEGVAAGEEPVGAGGALPGGRGRRRLSEQCAGDEQEGQEGCKGDETSDQASGVHTSASLMAGRCWPGLSVGAVMTPRPLVGRVHPSGAEEAG